MKDNSVLTQCQWWFNLALRIHWQPDTLGDAVRLRQQTVQAIESLHDEQWTDKEMLSIRYALAALLDELIAHSAWNEKDKWLARPLQVILFDDHLAGEKFFVRLAALLAESTTQPMILHVYHTCLQLGFRGGYRLQNPELLNKLKQTLARRLLADSEPVDTEELPQMDSTTTDKWWQRHVVNKRIIYGSAVGLSALIYLAYQIISWQLHQRIVA
jgi:type IV/VI secretion system ImpK/VasF family protein